MRREKKGKKTKVTIAIPLQDGVFAGKFRILEQLGHGEMSVVYRAHHLTLDQEVAIKFPRLSSPVGEKTKKYILEGARILASLHHPHLVRILDADIYQQKIPYVVMELLRGRNLALLACNTPLTLRLAFSVIIPLADALSYAHQRGVIHRDIKPQNVILVEKHRPILVGFDLAAKRATQEAIPWHNLDSQDLQFLAPEFLLKGESGPSSDIWSLGLLFVFLLTGTPPLGKVSTKQILQKLETQKFQPLKHVAPLLPQKVCKLLQQMLAYAPEDRPSSMEEVRLQFIRLEEELFLRKPRRLIVESETPIEDLNHHLEKASRGAYTILAKKEGGTFGIVYKAKDVKLGRMVAIKILRSQYAQSREAVLRFQREAQAMSLIRHPNVVEVFTIGEVEGLPFFVMPFVGDTDLEKLLIHEKRLKPRRALGLGYYIAKGLEAAHEVRVIHRDLKPANILLTPKGMPVITDFGVAHLPYDKRLTNSATIVGTFCYMAPEVIHGHIADERSDLYALGVILYEMIAGTLPFQGKNVAQLVRNIVESDPPPLAHWGAAAPQEVEDLIFSLLHKNPEKRIPTARKVAKAIKALFPIAEVSQK